MYISKPPVDTSWRSPNKGGYGSPHDPMLVVCHITEGTDSRGWLCNPNSGASSNYLIQRDGVIYELVSPDESAWANGAVCQPDRSNPVIDDALRGGKNLNTVSISIEHEGFSSHDAGGSLETIQWAKSIWLTAWLCQEYGIPPDAEGIIGHRSIDDCDRHYCPGWSDDEWAGYLGRVIWLLGGEYDGEGTVKEPEADIAIGYVNAQGETILVVNFGGQSVDVEGAAWVEVGATTVNKDGERYSRTLRDGQMEPWQGPHEG